MSTVERRSCSAISPNPGMAMLVRSVCALANDDVGFLESSAANEFERKRFADGFGAKLAVNVFEPRNRVAGESYKNVADDDASFVSRALGFDFEEDGCSLVITFQGFSQRIRQTHRLQADAKVAAGDAAFFQKRVHNAIHSRSGDGDGPKARESWRRDADGSAAWVNDCSADGRWLQAEVEANVRGKSCTRPGGPLRYNQANGAERSHWTTGACASDDEREAAGLDCGDIARIRNGRSGFRAFQNSEVGGSIAACKRS